MNVITITREYGAGGGYVASRLAESLGWDVLDRELLHQAAQIEHVPDAELERLDEQSIGMVDRLRLHPPHQRYLHGLQAAVAQAVQRGRVVLLGRGARHLLGDIPGTFHLRLVAPQDWRARRMASLEGMTVDQALARTAVMDRHRDRFTRYFFGGKAAALSEYDMVVNTGRVGLDEVVGVVAGLVRGDPPATARVSARVLTLSRELGAGEAGFAPTLGGRLAMHVYDRELLEQEAVRLGVRQSELERIDERPAGIVQRLRPGSLYPRYYEALRRLMEELAEHGDVILVGRGGSRILRDAAGAFHVRLVAAMPVRIRRVMEYRWVHEDVARKLIGQSDTARRDFFREHFGADWSSPLEYDLTVNSGRLGPAAVELVARAAQRRWSRGEPGVLPTEDG